MDFRKGRLAVAPAVPLLCGHGAACTRAGLDAAAGSDRSHARAMKARNTA